MSTVEEALSAPTPMGAVLAAGEDVLSLYPQVISFFRYKRMVLPIDGFVFWVKADLITSSALLNSSVLNDFELDQSQTVENPANRLDAKGSIHVVQDVNQEVDAVQSNVQVIFTSQVPVQDLNAIAPDELYLAEFDGVQFAFSSRGGWYKQANTWHYRGISVQSFMKSQIISDARTAQTLYGRQIVSNSLPVWLSLPGYAPAWPVPLPMPAIPLFPSMLSPFNYPKAYGTVHIEPDATQAIQSVPSFDRNMSQDQLCRDHVTIHFYGVDNQMAQTFLAAVLQFMYDNNIIGLMNVPTVRDGKRGALETLTLAQQKRIVFDVSYRQGVMRDVARKLIKNVIVDVLVPQSDGSVLIAETETNVIIK